MSMRAARGRRPGYSITLSLVPVLVIVLLLAASLRAGAAPYAAMVMDARTGEVLHSSNADTRLHPASLTKMMTLYVAFEAVENGEIGLDDKVRISRNAAAEVPSKLGLRAGSYIEFRYLIRAAAVKSANDAATAIGEAIEGSEAAFARRMNRTAKALGMTRTRFKNAHGLTEQGHMSTARDMTVLGRHLFYDYPEYYNLFSRRSTSAKLKTVYNTNRRFLAAYRGADGIKTGYTRAAGFNLVASAERGSERVIATVFGGNSTASRNREVARLLDLGFDRAPRYAEVRKPSRPRYVGGGTGRAVLAVARSLRPAARPLPAAPVQVAALDSEIEQALAVTAGFPAPDVSPGAPRPPEMPEAANSAPPARPNALAPAVAIADAGEPSASGADAPAATPVGSAPATATADAQPRIAGVVEAAATAAAEAIAPRSVSFLATSPTPEPRPRQADFAMAATTPADTTAPAEPVEIVARASTSGGRHWAITLGAYPSRFAAERALLKTALAEMSTLDGALRKVARGDGGFRANFVGLSEEQAQLACRRLQARGAACTTMSPG